MTAMAPVLGVVAITFGLVLIAVRAYVAISCRMRTARTIAFLHPFCNDGGGGERVLWVAIREMIERHKRDSTPWRVVVYTGDPITGDAIRANAATRFGVEVPGSVQFVHLSLRGWIEPYAPRRPNSKLLPSVPQPARRLG
jgi:alpha-1,2-mannosyltransferase